MTARGKASDPPPRPMPPHRHAPGVFVERYGDTVAVVAFDSEGHSTRRYVVRWLPGSPARCRRRAARALRRQEKRIAWAKSVAPQ